MVWEMALKYRGPIQTPKCEQRNSAMILNFYFGNPKSAFLCFGFLVFVLFFFLVCLLYNYSKILKWHFKKYKAP